MTDSEWGAYKNQPTVWTYYRKYHLCAKPEIPNGENWPLHEFACGVQAMIGSSIGLKGWQGLSEAGIMKPYKWCPVCKKEAERLLGGKL